MNMIMNNNLPLLNQEFKLPVYKDYLNMLNEMIRKSNGDKTLPINQKELDIFAQSKTPILNKYLQVNLTKKKKNTARDIMSDFFFNTTDGYQELKGRWVKCYEELILALENAKESPEKMFIGVNAGEEFGYLIDNEADITCGRSNWNNDTIREITDEDYWSDMTGEQYETLKKVYMVSQIVVENNSNGTGFYYEDMNYIESVTGFNFVDKNKKNYKLLDNNGDLIILMMTRPSDKELGFVIGSLKTLINRLENKKVTK